LVKKKKVLVVVTNDVSTDQRIHKVSKYLLEKGFEVEVYGRILPDTFEISRAYKIIRKQHWFNFNFLFYAEFNIRLFFYLFFNRYSHIMSNDLDTLPACYLGSKIQNSKLVYDSHEYFTETPELQGRDFVRKFWLLIEKIILPRIGKAITVSQPIADVYSKKYGVEMVVVRNLPEMNRDIILEDVCFPTKNKVVLYQGVLNPGRGIKILIEALKYLDGVDLAIIGYGKVKEDLINFAKYQMMEDRVHFIGRVAYDKLPNYSKKASVGMVLEEPMGKSFEFSLPNKLFDFIHAGLPFVAAPLIEVSKIVNKYNVGVLVDNYTPKNIACKVNLLLEYNLLREEIISNQNRFKKELCWEKEVRKLDIFFN
jgi:glycosyltransferase involved in cell wall biosynthesis